MAAPTDPRSLPLSEPIARPERGEAYPQSGGLPYPDPDRDPQLDPTVGSLVPNTAVVGGANFTVRVLGTNFGPGAVILWNGSPEPTTRVSATELTTGVNMATVSGPYTVPISVLDRNVASNAMPFTFTAT